MHRLDKKHRNLFPSVLLGTALVLGLGKTLFASAAGSASGAFLLKSPSPRANGMAESFASIGTDVGGISALYYNPAAAAFLPKRQWSFAGHRGVGDDHFGTFFMGFPTPYGNFSGDVFYYRVGDIELINTLGQSRTVTAEQDYAAGLNYADVWGGIYGTGLTAKIIHSKLLDDFSATTIAADLGVQVRLMEDRLCLGLAAQNIGGRLKYNDRDEPLTLAVRGGASYRILLVEGGHLLFSLDGYNEKGDRILELAGFEYKVRNLISLRTGYRLGQQPGRMSFGLGFFVRNYQLDYAFVGEGNMGSAHTVSITYPFDDKGATLIQEEY